ncbi:MAG: DUF962 domain-containing protein [Flavobacteriaceae bacterium]|nr:DUF962 domain-containing protein [Flavobacteriaceae bacterium]
MERIKKYSEFYAFYLTEHSNKTSRILHFIGTFLFFTFLTYIVFNNQWFFWWVLPLIGYGFAWVGHFFFEKNKPATFKYPFWSLISDFKLFFELLVGKQKF